MNTYISNSIRVRTSFVCKKHIILKLLSQFLKNMPRYFWNFFRNVDLTLIFTFKFIFKIQLNVKNKNSEKIS